MSKKRIGASETPPTAPVAAALGAGLTLLVAAWLLMASAELGVPSDDAAAWQPALHTARVDVGKASWYGPRFHGRPTASGVPFNRYALTAASRSLRAGTLVRVTNLRNQRSTLLLINDWGPVPEDRIIDVSEAAADILGFREQGLAPVRVEVLAAELTPEALP
ncbi:MAG: septal ring lytic transglycosylase RlpA family protein [Terriglobia bacterium]